MGYFNCVLISATMKTDYAVVSSYRNRNKVNALIDAISNHGFSCYNFCDEPSDPNNPDAHPEEQMKVFESTENFYEDYHFQKLFKRDLEGLKNAQNVILLHPCGLSAHIEAGIAFGLGKRLIMIGKPAKPETLYLIFQERYETSEDFLSTLRKTAVALAGSGDDSP